MNGLTPGRMVHYVAPGSADGTYPQAHRAAVITDIHDPYDGIVGLAVLNPTGIHFTGPIHHDPEGASFTWHWIEREDI